MTADAVGSRPAPLPENVSEPDARPMTRMQFCAPTGSANGWRSGTNAGVTPARSTPPGSAASLRAQAMSFTRQPMRMPNETSSRVSWVMPRRAISGEVTARLNASCMRIASLCAASIPSTSLAGSASA